jgi:hypothetical protein
MAKLAQNSATGGKPGQQQALYPANTNRHLLYTDFDSR